MLSILLFISNKQIDRQTKRQTDRQSKVIPPSIFTLFLVTSFRNGLTKAYAIGNILGAAMY